ncbi:putative Ig domain-containing protein [Streptomyces sp. ODS05-4]|uniref:putative Ig domain-containing protein n=1 Tax=Streptomyces sp. ODS05-4 TaxID=2944939 RepID=UPI00210AC852|nr:putative Ig domain-containing protein [Streptomyces sp. ODS05-4]
MKSRLSRAVRRGALTSAGFLTAGVLSAGVFSVPAQAGPSGPPEPPGPLLTAMQRDLGLDAEGVRERLADEAAATRTAAALRSALGGDLAGYWFDAARGGLVAAVTGDAAAEAAGKLGADARRVDHSAARLAAAQRAVSAHLGDGAAGVRSWGVDVRRNQVVIEVDRAAPAPSLPEGLPRGIVHVQRTGDAPRQQGGEVRGGDTWVPGGESPCSVGFSVTGAGGEAGFLTAGHCTNDVSQPAYGKDGSRVGTSNKGGGRSVNAREGDFGLVAVDAAGWSLSALVSGHGQGDVPVTGSADGVVGQSICRSGQTTGWRCGEITRVDQSVDYGNVVIDGLSYTDACSAGGDSGGAYVTATGGKAVGLHSGGGSVTCGQSGTPFTIFQPVGEALGKWNLTLKAGAPQPGEVTVAPVADQTFRLGTPVTLRNTAQGGTRPYVWTATGLPAGLGVDGATGTVSGTPNREGSGTVTVTATDKAGVKGFARFSWTVDAAGAGEKLTLAQPGHQNAYVGRPFALRLSAGGGTGARTFSAQGLPAGLSVDRATGVVSGTPTVWGSSTSRITVSDAAGASVTVSVNWTVWF